MQKEKITMVCLVTGAAGFIGSHLCERLIKDGHRVIGIDNLVTGRVQNLRAIKDNPNFHFFADDIHGDKLQEAMDGVDWCFHLAALADIVPSIEKPVQYHHVNVTGTIRVLEEARRANVKRFIYAASSSCYGIPHLYPTPESADMAPMYPYALTKWMGEQYVMHWANTYSLPCVSLRLFNVYGPRHRTGGAYGAVFGVFLSQLANGAPLTIVGDGTQKRDFTFVSDVTNAFVLAAKSSIFGRALNVGSDSCYEINHLARLLGGESCAVEHIPKRPGEPDITLADTTKATRLIDYRPQVSFEEGVGIMRELIPEYKDAPLWTRESINKATKPWFKYLGEGEYQ